MASEMVELVYVKGGPLAGSLRVVDRYEHGFCHFRDGGQVHRALVRPATDVEVAQWKREQADAPEPPPERVERKGPPEATPVTPPPPKPEEGPERVERRGSAVDAPPSAEARNLPCMPLPGGPATRGGLRSESKEPSLEAIIRKHLGPVLHPELAKAVNRIIGEARTRGLLAPGVCGFDPNPSQWDTPEQRAAMRTDGKPEGEAWGPSADRAPCVMVSEPGPAHDPVEHPAHYTFGQIEVIDALEDWKLGHHEATAIKYIARAGRKDPNKRSEDLRKAVWYLQRRIALLERDQPNLPGIE